MVTGVRNFPDPEIRQSPAGLAGVQLALVTTLPTLGKPPFDAVARLHLCTPRETHRGNSWSHLREDRAHHQQVGRTARGPLTALPCLRRQLRARCRLRQRVHLRARIVQVLHADAG